MDKLEKWRGYVPDAELETYRKGGVCSTDRHGRAGCLAQYRYDPYVC